MSVYKDNATGKWRVIYRYTDITGKRKQKKSTPQETSIPGSPRGLGPSATTT